MKIDDEIQAVIAAPETSFWLKKALGDATGRDCIDALNDAELLVRLLRERYENIVGRPG